LSFVVDASFAAAWCFEDEVTVSTEAQLDRCARAGAFVPSIWKFEIANLLRTAERKGRITEADADRSLEFLLELAIEDEGTSNVVCWQDVVPIARQHTLTIYDASYIELALRLQLPLATRDKEMIAAARHLMIDVIEA
jgi:predicted nucleic acid-binding protein